jgi:hypothetical protein
MGSVRKNKMLFAEILLKTYWFRFLLIWVPFKKLVTQHPCTGTLNNPKMSYKLRHLISEANKWTFWSNKCLSSVLAARSILNRKNMQSQAYLGLLNENEDLKAHAWIVSGDVEVVPQEKNYTKVFDF